MNINKNSLLKSLFSSVIILIFAIFYLSIRYEDIYDNVFSVFIFFIIALVFVTSLYWTYKQIEYQKIKYKYEKRPWYSWLWWPSRRLEEVYYWRATSFVTIFFPSIVFLCLVFILGYSIFIGLIFAIIMFFIIIFSITEFSNLRKKSNQKNNEKEFPFRKYNMRITIILVLIFIFMIISLPYIEEPKGSFQEQKYIGTWKNSEITLNIKNDYTCTAAYRNSSYNGSWTLIKGLGHIEVAWYQRLKLPHPNDSSYLYTVEQIFLIDNASKLSLYTPFSAPDYLTLEKV